MAGASHRLAGALALLVAFVPPASAGPRADVVYQRIAERLSLMKPVAAWKLANGVPVEDLEREAVVLARATADAAAAGIAPETAEPFVRVQIEAAKEIQRCWIERWTSNEQSPPVEVPDLATEIRPRLLEIGEALLVDVSAALAYGVTFRPAQDAGAQALLDIACLSDSARGAVGRELEKVRLAP